RVRSREPRPRAPSRPLARPASAQRVALPQAPGQGSARARQPDPAAGRGRRARAGPARHPARRPGAGRRDPGRHAASARRSGLDRPGRGSARRHARQASQTGGSTAPRGAGRAGPPARTRGEATVTEATPRGPDSVRRSLSWTMFGELGFAASQWLSLMVIAKLGSAEALGRYSLGFAVSTPI